MNNITKLLVTFSLLVLAAAISSNVNAQDKTPASIEAGSLGSTKNVHKAGNLFFAGQFTKDDIATIGKAKVARVITLRTDGEIDWDEEAAVKAANMEFIKVPFRTPESLTDEVFDTIRTLLNDKTKTTLFHCGSANRVGGVWLPFRVLDEGVDLETALAEAKKIGLKAPFVEQKALDYIKRQQAKSTNDDEVSVKPGINNRFVNPNLDVDSYVKRFEIESREVFVQRERILAACGIEKGDTVADVGAGTGLFTRMFSVAVGNEGWVYAVDISPRFIEHINAEATKHELQNITGVLCAENSINLPSNSADVVFVCDTYHHFEYPRSTSESIHRALRPGGELFVIDFERIEGVTRPWLMEHVRAGKDVVIAELESYGFELLEELEIEGLTENYALRFRRR